jgi:hypothetical protein
MKQFVMGFLVGATIVYWSGERSDDLVASVTAWFEGAAGHYQGEGDADTEDTR